jgi:hypothetical protein
MKVLLDHKVVLDYRAIQGWMDVLVPQGLWDLLAL